MGRSGFVLPLSTRQANRERPVVFHTLANEINSQLSNFGQSAAILSWAEVASPTEAQK